MSFRKLVAVVAAFAALSANAQFWRDPGFITSGGAFTGGLAGPDGGCPTPTYGFSSETLGFYKKASQTIAVCTGGVPRIAFSASSIAQSAAQSLVWSNNNNDPTATVDLSLFKDAQDVFAQRRGTNAQAFRVYNTYTDAANYERLSASWSVSANEFVIRTEQAGTGVARDLVFGANNSRQWRIAAATGNLLTQADNTTDIGASGATRPRTLYLGTDLFVDQGKFHDYGSGQIGIGGAGASYMYVGANTIQSTGNNGFSFGTVLGTSDAFIVRDGADIIAQRRTTNAQTFRIYNTYTDASNYERLEIGANVGGVGANTFGVLANNGGTGSNRDLYIGTATSAALKFRVGGTDRWQISGSSGHLVPTADQTYNIGASGNQALELFVSKDIQGRTVKTLTEASATGFVTFTVSNSSACSGHIDYQVFAADATNTQVKSGQLYFSAVANSTGTVTAATVSDVNTLNPVSSGTLTNTMDSTTAANALTIRANATSSLTQTTLEIRWRAMMHGTVCSVTAL